MGRIFAEGEDVMKTEEVSSQNSSKLVLRVTGILIAILVLGSMSYEWIKSDNWDSYTRQNSGLVDNNLRAIAIDSSDRVWVGTYRGGVSVFNGENWKSYTTQNSGLVDDDVHSIAIDSSDKVWIGTENGGISVFDGENWENHTTQNSGLVHNNVRTIAIDSSDRVWVGTEGGGINVLAGNNWRGYTAENSGLVRGRVDAIAFDSSERVWFGAYNGLVGGGGVTKRHVVSVFDGDSSWRSYNPLNPDLVMSDFGGGVTTIAFDSSDRVWVGTLNIGLSAFDGKNWEGYTTQNSGLVSDWVNAIAIDSSDRVWVATQNEGLSIFDGENWLTYTEDNSGILDDSVEAIALDNMGFMWIGTRGGINRVPIGERLQVTPLIYSIWDLFFSPKLSLWRNLSVVIILGNVAFIFSDRKKAVDEQEPAEEDKVSKRRPTLQGSAGGLTASVIVLLSVSGSGLGSEGFGPSGIGLFAYGIACLAIPVSLLIGLIAGFVGQTVFKTTKVAYLSGFLVLLGLEVPLVRLFMES